MYIYIYVYMYEVFYLYVGGVATGRPRNWRFPFGSPLNHPKRGTNYENWLASFELPLSFLTIQKGAAYFDANRICSAPLGAGPFCCGSGRCCPPPRKPARAMSRAGESIDQKPSVSWTPRTFLSLEKPSAHAMGAS